MVRGLRLGQEYDTRFLPPHLRVHGLAERIHQNAQSRLRDIVSPRLRRIDVGTSQVQGPPNTLKVYRFGRQDHPRAPREREITGSRGLDRDRWEDSRGNKQRGTNRPRQQRGLDNNRPRQQHGPPQPDQNRRPYLADVQCDACKRVGHVAKHCDILATAICLERYMKHDLAASMRDLIDKDWLTCWNECLGNPDRTPRQVMRTYV